MQQNQFYSGNNDMQQLLINYQNLKKGISHSFISEESFEKIIDYFDDIDNLPEALLASNIALEQFPYCAEIGRAHV